MRWQPSSNSRAPVTKPELRVAVIGAGDMGRNHIRIYDEMENVDLVAIADPSEAAVKRAIGRRAINVYTDYRDLLATEQVDAISIVVPSTLHYDVAMEAIARKVHVLVEKPIASTSEEGRDMVEAADRAGIALAVGHVERFNPAVVALKALLAQGTLGEIFEVKARRTGPFPARIRDVGVTIDLATHDLDVMLDLVGSPLRTVFGQVQRNIHTSHEDLMTAVVRFASGPIGTLDINWLTPHKVRDLTLVGERGMFIVDYLLQNLTFYENAIASAGWDQLNRLTGVSEGQMIRYAVQRSEPLVVELTSFIGAVRTGASPVVDGRDGVIALEAAEAVLASSLHGAVVTMAPLPWAAERFEPARVVRDAIAATELVGAGGGL